MSEAHGSKDVSMQSLIELVRDFLEQVTGKKQAGIMFRPCSFRNATQDMSTPMLTVGTQPLSPCHKLEQTQSTNTCILVEIPVQGFGFRLASCSYEA